MSSEEVQQQQQEEVQQQQQEEVPQQEEQPAASSSEAAGVAHDNDNDNDQQAPDNNEAAAASPPEAKRARVAKELPEGFAQLDWHALAKSGLVEKQKLPLLKAYSKQHGLPMTGNKPEFIVRVLAHLGDQQQPASE